MNGMIGLLNMMNDNSFRNTAVTTNIGNNIVVDTVFTPDTGRWETGVERDDNGWVIVEQYSNETSAKSGHRKWVALLTADPTADLKNTLSAEDWFFGNSDSDIDDESPKSI